MVETALQAQDPLITSDKSTGLLDLLANVNLSEYGTDQASPYLGLDPENRRLFQNLIGNGKESSTKEAITGIDPKQYLENGVSVKDFSSLKMNDISSLLGGKPKKLSGAEKSLLFFLGMAQNASKPGSTLGGSLTAGTTVLGTGMLKRVQDIRKYDKELPLKTLQVSNLLSKQESERRKERGTFRKQWLDSQEVKDMKKAIFDYSRLREAAAVNPDNPLARGVGDLALVFNFMKLLDPGSVVRESEFRAAAGAGALGQQIKNFVDKPISGALFTPEVRADFVQKGTNFLKGRGQIYDDLYNQTKQIASSEGFRKNEIDTVVPYTDWKKNSLIKYGDYKDEQEEFEQLEKDAAQQINFTAKDKELYRLYVENISSHPRIDDINKILKQEKPPRNYYTLTLDEKMGLLRAVEQAR